MLKPNSETTTRNLDLPRPTTRDLDSPVAQGGSINQETNCSNLGANEDLITHVPDTSMTNEDDSSLAQSSGNVDSSVCISLPLPDKVQESYTHDSSHNVGPLDSSTDFERMVTTNINHGEVLESMTNSSPNTSISGNECLDDVKS